MPDQNNLMRLKIALFPIFFGMVPWTLRFGMTSEMVMSIPIASPARGVKVIRPRRTSRSSIRGLTRFAASMPQIRRSGLSGRAAFVESVPSPVSRLLRGRRIWI